MKRILKWSTISLASAITLDYLLVKQLANVNYCNENAQLDLLGTFNKRNPSEPSMIGIDHYRTITSKTNNPTQQQEDHTISQLVNSFFSNPLFRLQTKLLDEQVLSEQQVDACKFEIGDKLSNFTLMEKNDREMLWKSNDGFLLWFKIQPKNGNELELNFGSSMLSNSPMNELPIIVDSMVLNLHFLYARYLLLFTKNKFNKKYN